MPTDLKFPERATDNDSYQLARFCSELDRQSDALVVDCRDTLRFGPLGVTMLASAIALRRTRGWQTELALPTDDDARGFVKEVGLDRFIAGETTGLGTLEVRQLHALDAVYTLSVVDLLAQGVPGRITEANSYPIQLCLNELLQNVFEWSQSPVGCVVLARWFRKSRSVRLAVVDRGIGIPAELRRFKIHALHRASDADVIKAAVMTPALTSRKNRVGGLGLKTIRDVVCGRAGRLTVVSLGAKVTWSDDRISQYNSPAFRGTAVEIDIRPDPELAEPDAGGILF